MREASTSGFAQHRGGRPLQVVARLAVAALAAALLAGGLASTAGTARAATAITAAGTAATSLCPGATVAAFGSDVCVFSDSMTQAAWTAPPLSLRLDGVPATAYPRRPEHTEPDFPGRDFSYGHDWGASRFGSASAYHAAGVTCVLTTAPTRRAEWLRTGQALQRALLTAAAAGVAAALHSQPVEIGFLRDLLRSQLCAGAYPQLVLRLGTVIQTSASVRRPVAEVLRFSAGASTGQPPLAARSGPSRSGG